ncbi:MAG: TonB-dependent receptor [Bacteroidetes bacterium]|nr:TonB-dependent receptor [Bacteroidota bacterium]
MIRTLLFYPAIAILFILALSRNNLYAQQNTGTIRGIVSDSTNGEALAFANVYIQSLNRGTTSDRKGLFFLTSIPSNRYYAVTVSYLGYKTKTIHVIVSKDRITEVDFELNPTEIELETIEKVAEQISKEKATDAGLDKISIKDVERLPRGVETDIFRSLNYLPGVQSAGDISARYYVRGSNSNQNLVLIEGATIYNPYHALGLFSVVDPEMINSIEFYKGGFTAEYGGRLSSVLRLVTKDGNRNKYSGKASASLLSGKILFEGPIPDGSFMITGRKNYSSDILKKFLNDQSVPADFYDFSFKVNYANDEVMEDGKFTVHGFFSGDNILNEDPAKTDFKWNSNLVGIKWFQLSNTPLFYEAGFYISSFRGEVIPNESKAKPQINDVTDISVRFDFKYLYDSKDEIDLGFHIQEIKTFLEIENLGGLSKNIGPTEGAQANISVYGKYKVLRFDNFGADIGTRINIAGVSSGAGKNILEPRISLTYTPLPEISLKGAWGIYQQELTTLSDEDQVITIFEPWLINPSYIDPSQSNHFVLGIETYFLPELELNVEGYYKKSKNIPSLNYNKITEDDPEFVSSKEESYGAEFYTRYHNSQIDIIASYTLGWAFKEVDGQKYHPRYDSRHTYNLIFAYNFSNGWSASANWNFSSGLPFTQLIGYYNKLYFENPFIRLSSLNDKNPYPILSGRNLGRLPDYHRMDLSLSKKFTFDNFSLYVDLSIINIYNRENIFYFDRETGEKVNMLPFLPTATVKVEL